ncbi:MAG: DNA mismatch repair endonuclease MutL [Acholeplasmatales bacterium]|nr:DNA mismatch repair endonuclease MutL [Acholeplasmatales bacterium]
MGKIMKMAPELYNMIAAGEVVERPFSVVKELVENAIDAKSSEIKIYLINGGLEGIIVSDNGEGMDKDDVLLSFIPHATSKIKNEYDLFRINTLGFRGEAIASIASVSRCEITSSIDGVNGYRVVYKGGVKKEEGVYHSNKGTSVNVSELFANTPARLKYLKSAKSEMSSILFFIERIALAHKDIRFNVFNDNKLVFSTSGSNNISNLIGEIYGVDACKNIISSQYVSDGYKASLVLIKPYIYRSNKLEVTLIVNGRYVRNYNISNAIISGFDTYIPIGKYPIAIIYLEIDPLLIDVNVHPNKTEIKIANESDICIKITDEIKNVLKNTMVIPERKIEKNNNIGYQKTTIFNTSVLNEDTPKYESKEFELNIEDSDEEIKYGPVVEKKENVIIERKLPYFEYVGCVFGTYLVFQNNDGLYLMDQHAAAERCNYEKYYKILGDSNQPSSELLFPISLQVSKKEALYIEENMDKFEKIGFSLDEIGDKTFVIRRVPLWAKIDNLESIIYDIIAKMINEEKIDIIYFRDHIAKQISCKASIKANHQLSRVEVEALVNNLNKCENPYTCPHGRPTIIKLSQTDLEKMFERIQK